jgi:DNA-binding SARP family transcriptional activator
MMNGQSKRPAIGPPADGDPAAEALLEQSSFGTDAAKSLRDRAAPAAVGTILRRATELAAAHANASSPAQLQHSQVGTTEDVRELARWVADELGARFTKACNAFGKQYGAQVAVAVDAMTFRILGPMEVRGTGGTIRIPPGRQQVVLASLLMEANQIVTVDHLVDALWDDAPPSTARTQVQICVARLRKSLSSVGVHTPILSQPPGYLLRVDESMLDMHVFTSKLAKARALAREGRTADSAALLRSAAALWRGPCLTGIPQLRTQALRLGEDRLDAIETYIELEIGLGLHHHLVGELTRLVHEHPLRERLRGLLMRALYLAGRPAEALAVYQAGRDILIDELGLEPGEELRALQRAILIGETPDVPAVAAELAPPREERPHKVLADTDTVVRQFDQLA